MATTTRKPTTRTPPPPPVTTTTTIIHRINLASFAERAAESYERDLYNFSSLYRSLGFDIEFGMVSETKLPVILSAPASSCIPSGSPFVCLFGRPWERESVISSSVLPVFSALEARLLSFFADAPARPDEFSATHFLVCETMGHVTRCKACFEKDPVERSNLFKKAYAIYEGVISATCHSSMIEALRTVRRSESQKAVLFQPAPDLVDISPDMSRILSHSFAGMALCSLMMMNSLPEKFFSLVSASLCYEKAHPMELACTLRLLPFMMMGLFSGDDDDGSAAAQQAATTTTAMITTRSAQNFWMGTMVTEKVLLPAILAAGRKDLFDAELAFLRPYCQDGDSSNDKKRFAMALHQRMIDRRSAPTPLNSIRTRVVDGRILERKCANCGEWDRTGKSFSRCSGCMLVYYCGRECQLAHWSEHKKNSGCTNKKK